MNKHRIQNLIKFLQKLKRAEFRYFRRYKAYKLYYYLLNKTKLINSMKNLKISGQK